MAIPARCGLWVVLASPGAWLLWLWGSGDSTAHYLLLPSGKYCLRAAIIALAAGPLRHLFPRQSWSAWLLSRRRAFGVAACAYALLHLVFYVIDEGSLRAVLGGLREPAMVLGWLSLGGFVLLGAISNDRAVRHLGPLWPRIQRWAPLAAALGFAHWWWLGHYLQAFAVHLALFVVPRLAGHWPSLRGRARAAQQTRERR